MRHDLEKTVVLVGMMGAGKTAVGTALARILGVPFLDSDAEIEHAANMSIAEIFARDGEAFFRRKETQVIERLLHGQPGVLSTGGGAFMQAENRALIGEYGVSVWLRASLDTLWNRVKHKDTRPLLRTADPYGTLKALADAREPIYAAADLAIESGADQAVDDMAHKVIKALQAHPGAMAT
ncbi:MAG: shikimate kinase [Deltaproteobacteria bacterium]